MQRQITVELRFDVSDTTRAEQLRKDVLEITKHLLVQAQFVCHGDAMGLPPQVAVYSDDFFTGHEDIDAMEDIIGKAKQQFDNVSGNAEVSDELVQALRDSKA